MHVETDMMHRARTVLADAARDNVLTAIWGDAGLGKTYTVENFVDGLAGVRVAVCDVPVAPTIRTVTLALLGALTGSPQIRYDTFSARAEVGALLASGQPTVVVIDEAQRLDHTGFELLRSYHDNAPTFALVFVGGPSAWEVISRHPMLESRVRCQLQFKPLPLQEFYELLPTYDPIYDGISTKAAMFLYDSCRNGFLRDLKHVTDVAKDVMRTAGARPVDEALLNAVLLRRGVR